jgi:hypothetical protein
MLLEEEKERIRAEELFRHEIRREIESKSSKHSRGKRLWLLLNTSFALWFLSSVVLGGLTAAIASYQKYHSEWSRKAETQRRLNTEISNRISEALDANHLYQQRINSGQVNEPSAESVYMNVLDYLDNHVTYDGKSYDFSIYPEYQQRKFRSLIFELSLVADRPMLPALRDADANYTKLTDLADQATVKVNLSTPDDKNTIPDAFKKSTEVLERLQGYSFWQTQL